MQEGLVLPQTTCKFLTSECVIIDGLGDADDLPPVFWQA
jgi:hypothetical protein